jgi:hypothetical protein
MKIEHYIAALSKLYAQEGRRSLQEILVGTLEMLPPWRTT